MSRRRTDFASFSSPFTGDESDDGKMLATSSSSMVGLNLTQVTAYRTNLFIYVEASEA